jgi:hypothetical protein
LVESCNPEHLLTWRAQGSRCLLCAYPIGSGGGKIPLGGKVPKSGGKIPLALSCAAFSPNVMFLSDSYTTNLADFNGIFTKWFPWWSES